MLCWEGDLDLVCVRGNLVLRRRNHSLDVVVVVETRICRRRSATKVAVISTVMTRYMCNHVMICETPMRRGHDHREHLSRNQKLDTTSGPEIADAVY